MVRSFVTLVGLVAGAALWAAPAFALAYTSPGHATGYVNDFAHVLSQETVQNLNTELARFEASTSNEVAVVTVQNMHGDYIENYAVQLFKEWGIGKKDKDNGVLLLLAIDERKLRIEVGYGLEGALPDSVAQRIVTNDMTPLLKAVNYDSAVTVGVQGIESATQGEYVGTGSAFSISPFIAKNWLALLFLPLFVLQWFAAVLSRSKSWYAGGIVGALVGVVVWFFFIHTTLLAIIVTLVLTAIGALFDYVVSNAYTVAKQVGVRPPWWAGGRGFGGSSGGFGGFGGGSSGGGGASGGW